MKLIRYTVLIVSFFLSGTGCHTARSVSPNPAYRVFVWDANNLHSVKQKIRQGDAFFNRAFRQLKQEGEEALKTAPFSVMNKTEIPPSGDKHDYMSFAPYWWPNPDAEGGLPYIRKDGERNATTRDQQTDRGQLGGLCDAVEALALCYYFTDDPRYAKQAAILLRTWFLNENTRMNPNLNYAQGIPGLNTGRCFGVIETSHMVSLVDSVGILQHSSYWTEIDQNALQQWFRHYLKWLTTSPLALEESQTLNNHSTWYDVQTTVFALYVEDIALARKILEQSARKDIQAKIEPDGSQPEELSRTKSYGYSLMNLRGSFVLARLDRKSVV